MKKSKATALLVTTLSVTILYCGYSLRGFYTKPQIEFAEGITVDEQKVILEWYDSTGTYGQRDRGIKEVFHALSHPHTGGSGASVSRVPPIGCILLVDNQYHAEFNNSDGVFKHRRTLTF